MTRRSCICYNQLDTMVQERVAQKENELNAAYDEKMRNYEERYVATLPCEQ